MALVHLRDVKIWKQGDTQVVLLPKKVTHELMGVDKGSELACFWDTSTGSVVYRMRNLSKPYKNKMQARVRVDADSGEKTLVLV